MLDSAVEEVADAVVNEDLSFELWLELLPVLVPWDDDAGLSECLRFLCSLSRSRSLSLLFFFL